MDELIIIWKYLCHINVICLQVSAIINLIPVYEPTTTYLLARDEDYENIFHSSSDFVNMFLVQQILGYDVAEQQILRMDRHLFGPYMSLL